MKKLILILPAIILMTACTSGTKKMEQQLKTFIDSLELKAKPLEAGAGLAYFNATTTGKQEEYQKYSDLNIQISKIYSDSASFATLKGIKESGQVKDSLLVRQMNVLYNQFLSNQIDPKLLEELIKAQTKLEEKYNTYRAQVDGKKLTDNEIDKILKSSANTKELKKVWEASKQIGDSAAAGVVAIVKMRNNIAQKLGFKNYQEMSLKLSEQDPEKILTLFDELDSLTRGTFITLKSNMDSVLAKEYKISPDQLMPWHYQNRFFQEAPSIYNIDLDSYFANKDVVELTKNYYAGIGLDITPILAKSDLFEREGKYQHAYCIHIDRSGDVRAVCNVKNNHQWMGTMLHEFGHGVYDYNIDMSLPYYLRTPAHTFTTEAIAMIFGRLASNPLWIRDNAGISNEEAEKISTAVSNSLKLEQIVFSRWTQVMFRFEKAMYENPDQDLNKLWWDLVEKYQMIKKPEGRNDADWASKIHIALYPCYYHNYQLGELLASQLQAYINTNILKVGATDVVSMTKNPEVGTYLLNKVFRPGARYEWNDMIKRATGEELTAKYYAAQFVTK
ncbi:MAG TPA: M2 family metallopeptidase [Bacteroidales bacterium]|nr:M2 family metallopeptidase [Bacteroidales bacterium]